MERVLAIKTYDLRLSNIQVETHFESGPFYVIANQHRLEEVFLNIVTNAHQAIADRDGPRHLLVRVGKNKDFIRASFTDSGPGIERKDQKRIFEPFFTTKGPGKGTGLGLSICRSILQEHGGRIWVVSEAAKGATFHVELPMAKRASGTLA